MLLHIRAYYIVDGIILHCITIFAVLIHSQGMTHPTCDDQSFRDGNSRDFDLLMICGFPWNGLDKP